MAEKWQRAAYAQNKWAERAKECFDMLEGRQWTEAQIAKRILERRPALKFNIISPIVRLVIGYQRSNRTDIQFKPGQDTRASEDTANALTKIAKVMARGNRQEYVDAAVFLDGIAGGRGWFDTRLDWENNDLGEARTVAYDPFMVYPDPDADTYDLNESASFLQTSKYVSIDEIENAFGQNVAELVKPYTMGQTPLAPLSSLVLNDEITPVRFFGERDGSTNDWWDTFYAMMGDFVDRQRKTLRLIESQYKVTEPRNVIIDLETGDKKTLPENWGDEQIQKCLLYAQAVNNPCVVQRRMVQRLHWTVMLGDLILYDAPSLYDKFTLTPYFPYFRRGMTRGMVDDLIDPQKEKNTRRSNEAEILSKTANGGWLYPSDAFDPVQERKLELFGSTPGVRIKYKASATNKPELIGSATNTINHERLENKADEDARRISGINESALGDTDISNQSGRAIEARQRQATISVQMYMDNFKLSKHLLGEQHLSVIQNYYTEQRMYRVTGEDGKLQPIVINQMLQDATSGGKKIMYDVTLGKYDVAIDDQPISATFKQAQFEEMMMVLKEMGPFIQQNLPAFADLIIAGSTLPQKDEWIQRLQQIAAAQQQAQAAQQQQQVAAQQQEQQQQAQAAQEAEHRHKENMTKAQPQPERAAGPQIVHVHPGGKAALRA